LRKKITAVYSISILAIANHTQTSTEPISDTRNGHKKLIY